MNESDREPPVHGTPADGQTPRGDVTGSVARRRTLLRNLSLGAATAAAGAPMKALAGLGGDRKYCFHKDDPVRKRHATVSGCHSVISSLYHRDFTESKGKSCWYYKSTDYWPKRWNNNQYQAYCKGVNNTAFTPDAPFWQLFGLSDKSGYNGWKIRDLMAQQISPHRHWITGCLNSTVFYDSGQFTYTSHELVSMFKDPAKQLACLTFLRDFQENSA
jgi:hypothetical protein